ncbi:DNA/RNA non-specific endonuclease [Listeria seeligeri]|uniref:DNA/RNA non-specific endonuclease n=1 Tax=Listeria seeligeri TaxID=1640 RepID=UPI001887C018|nr:DNA/RNA non-specific endonuclease [Listeria seeligeri]MBF2356012.1 DNA/RNA non-specific endonuclease [Listeria seeligeri]
MKKILISIISLILLSIYGLYQTDTLPELFPFVGEDSDSNTMVTANENELASLEYEKPNNVIYVNDNKPTFTEDELSLEKGSWQKFSELDQLNRVGQANAMLHKEMMPEEEREPLYINPTGWKNKKVSNGWLYNRCHLIGFQLTGENNNPKNLMTGTRSLNTPGMVDYENEVASYLRKTSNHVRYRVTPVFRGDELLARGVQMEAKSIENDEIQFNIYIFNVEEGVNINYQDGSSIIERSQ